MNTTASRPLSWAGLACLAITSVGWGLNWPAMKFLLRELPALFGRGTAGLVAALLVGGAALATRQSLRVPHGAFGRLLIASLVNVFAWMGFGTLSMRWLDVGQGALLVYTMPLWATLMAWPLRGEKPTRRAAAGLLLCVAGLWALFGQRAAPLSHDQWLGAGLALAAALLFAWGTVALKPVEGMPPLALLAWQLALGSLPMLLLSAAFEDPHPMAASLHAGLLWLYMTLVPMALCYFTWFAALRRVPPATASIATLLTPVIGVLSAAALLAEPLGTRELTALALTLGGVALALRR